MRLNKTLIAWYRGIAGLSVDRQRDICEDFADEMGFEISVEYVAGDHGLTNRDWLGGLGPTNAGIVANLVVLPEPRAKGNRPTSDLAWILAEVAGKKTQLIDAGRKSMSGEPGWSEVVRDTHDALSRGKRKLGRAEAQEMAKKSVKVRRARRTDIVRKWLSAAYAEIRETHAPIWRDPMRKTDEARFKALPKAVRTEIGNKSRARKIFGRKDPTKPTKSGRPRKAPAKT